MGTHAGETAGQPCPHDEPRRGLSVPTPSKFTQVRQATVLDILRAGGSRRQAAAAAGIAPKTLRRWLERGEKASRIAPGSSSGTFFEAVRSVEAGGPELVELGRRFEEASPEWLWKFVADEWKPDPPPAVEYEVEVRLHDGQVLTSSPLHDPAERSPA